MNIETRITPAAAAPISPALAESSTEAYRVFDRIGEALTGQMSGGISPAALAMATFDWLIHLASAPGKRLELANKAGQKTARLLAHVASACTCADTPPCVVPLPGDHRFRAEGWTRPPFSFWAQAFLLNQQWWHNVTHGVPGVTPHHEDVISFSARQMLDMLSPSNIPLTNPEVIDKIIATGGANFIQGFRNWLEDVQHLMTGRPPVGTETFVVGRDVANIWPGLVATTIFSFLLAWGDLLWALCLISSPNLQTMTLGVTQLIGQFRVQWSDIMAATTIGSAIPAILYVVLQRYLVQGFTESAVKG